MLKDPSRDDCYTSSQAEASTLLLRTFICLNVLIVGEVTKGMPAGGRGKGEEASAVDGMSAIQLFIIQPQKNQTS